MKILYCPAHYVYEGKRNGSEFSIAYNLADTFATKYKGSTIITGYDGTGKKHPYEIIEVQKEKKTQNIIDVGIKNAIIFNFQYYGATQKQLKEKNFSLLHHIFPFSIENTYDLTILLHQTKGLPTIIGPLPSPFQNNDTDVNPSDLHNFSNKPTVKKKIGIADVMKPILNMLSLQTMKQATYLIAMNAYTKQLLIQKGISPEKVVIIPPGISIQEFPFKSPEEKKPHQITILSVSYLMKRKAVDEIIKGFKQAYQENNHLRLRIVGDGPQKQHLEALAKKLHIDDVVFFDGYISHEQITKVYHQCDIFVCMSKEEGFSTVALESMASGLAVISTKVGGFIDVIEDGINGFLIDIGDYQQLAEKILLLASKKDLLHTISYQARKKAENFDWETKIIPQYDILYKKAITHHGS